jgi:hypothetical protein
LRRRGKERTNGPRRARNGHRPATGRSNSGQRDEHSEQDEAQAADGRTVIVPLLEQRSDLVADEHEQDHDACE